MRRSRALTVTLGLGFSVLAGIAIATQTVGQQQPPTAPAQTAPARPDLPARTVGLTKDEIEKMFGNLADWVTTDSVEKRLVCADGVTNDAAHHKVVRLTTATGREEVGSVYVRIVDALKQNHWQRCTPEAGDAPDGYSWSNTGPWYSETYKKNGMLLRVERSYSMGTGNSIAIFVEHEN